MGIKMLTLSVRGDIWHLALHIKHMPGFPERKVSIKDGQQYKMHILSTLIVNRGFSKSNLGTEQKGALKVLTPETQN